MNQRITISDEYLAEQKLLHQNPEYGVASLSLAPLVQKIMAANNIRSVSDYGAGKKNLKKGLEQLGVLGFQYFPYDPAFPEYGPAKPADLVCCLDVLEHIEPEFLEAVIADLAAITSKIGFFSIATAPAKKTLSDGRNAHLIQKPSSWWLPKLCEKFEIVTLWREGTNILMIVERRAS
jgi:hypothetical protein